jgi:hypothetical protein
MPASFNGFGTRYYGKCAHSDDQSYLTTEWIIALYIPVIPLKSLRLKKDPSRDKISPISTSEGYVVFQIVPIFWPQVLRVYAFVFGFIIWITALVALFYGPLKIGDSKHEGAWLSAMFFGMSIPWLMLLYMRTKEKRRARR